VFAIFRLNNPDRRVMMKRFLVLAGLLCSPAFAATHTPREIYEGEVEQVMAAHPEVSDLEICVEGVCETFYRERKGGTPEIMWQRPIGNDGNEGGVAKAIGDIVGSVGGKVGVGGRLVLDYDKKPDGTVHVHVEASFGAGSGAAAGASGGGNGGNGAPPAQSNNQ
jgi:hypothetical protein